MLSALRTHTRALERFFAAPFLLLRIPPTAITVFTLVPALVAAGLAMQGNLAWALLAGVVAAGLDFVDGTVARLSGRITRFGGYLDSVVDRVVDGLFLLGLGLGLNRFDTWILVSLCLLGSYGTSYAKARAFESLEGQRPPKESWNQFLERPERMLLLGLGVSLHVVLNAYGKPVDVLWWTLIVYAIGSNLTTLQRILRVRRLLA